MIQGEIQKLLQKDMNRRQFLAHIGAGFLMIIGVSGLIKHLLQFDSAGKNKQLASGYGASAYGGGRKK